MKVRVVRASLRSYMRARRLGWRVAWSGEGRFGLVKANKGAS